LRCLRDLGKNVIETVRLPISADLLENMCCSLEVFESRIEESEESCAEERDRALREGSIWL
jgi:hypothetical protein